MHGSEPGEINALLGHGTDFTGKLTFEGTVRIDGRFQGEVFTGDVLIIGEGAEVHAEIEVGTLIVKGGLVVGNIRARDAVEIHSPGRLVGNILSPSLYIGKGVVFDGHCRMRDESDEADNVAHLARPAVDAAEPADPEPEPTPRQAAGGYPPPTASAVPPPPSGWSVPPPAPLPKRR